MPKIPSDAENRISAAFQKRLAELIDDCGCNKAEFAVRAGVSVPVLTRALIYGIVPSLKALIKIADCANVSLAYLLGGPEDGFFKSQSGRTFHTRLLELMAEKGVKYSQIAKRMPFSCNFFYEWQREKTLPCLDYLNALAAYFSVSPDYLLGRTDER